MRKIITSDIHGCFSQFVKGLEEVRYNPVEDKLILLGDYIDRGTHSAQVVKYIRDLQEKYNVVALLGNHEDMAIDAHKNADYYLWNMNGGTQTHKSYYRGGCNSFLDDIKWFQQLPLYHIEDGFLFVHAGLDVSKSFDNQEKDDFVWSRSEWYCNADKYKDHNVVFGHTIVQCILNDKSCNDVIKIGQHFAIDTGCVFYGTMTFMIIEDNNIYFQKVLK